MFAVKTATSTVRLVTAQGALDFFEFCVGETGCWRETTHNTRNGGTNKTQHVVLHLGACWITSPGFKPHSHFNIICKSLEDPGSDTQ